MFDASLLLALALMAAGGALVFAFTRIQRVERDALASRVDRVFGAPALKAPEDRSVGAHKRFARLDAWVRWPFVVGLRRIWGATLATPWVGLIAITGACAAWFLLREMLHLPMWIVLLGGMATFLLMPRIVLLRQQSRADLRFMELFPDTIDMIVRMVRAGLPVAMAIRAVGEQGSHPVSDVFVRIADRSEIGIPLEDVLSDMGEEVGLEDFRFFAVSVGLQRSTGGNLARTLETFSDIIRQRRAVRLKARSATAEVRMSAIILGAIPFFVVGALELVNPRYLDPLIDDRRGNIVIGVAMSSLMLGALTMRWMIRSGTRV